MADLPGRDPPDHRGGEQDQRHGVLAVPDAAAPRHQVRVRGLAGVGGHPGHRAQQGQLPGVQAAESLQRFHYHYLGLLLVESGY